MIRELKHITTILLLVIFPISAIGFNVFIHRCKHKHTIHFSFYASSSRRLAYSDCCCSTCDIKHSDNISNDSSRKQDNKRKKDNECCDSKILEEEESSSNSCNKSAEENNQKQNKLNNESNNSRLDNDFSFNNIHTSCCANSDNLYAINEVLITLDDTTVHSEFSTLSSGKFQNVNFETNNQHAFSVAEVHYPLKALISQIISCMYFSSNTGDDPNIPVVI